MRIKMLRNVLVEGRHCATGEVVEVEDRLAETLIQWNRAEAAEEAGDEGAGQESGGKGAGEVEVETATRAGGKRK